MLRFWKETWNLFMTDDAFLVLRISLPIILVFAIWMLSIELH